MSAMLIVLHEPATEWPRETRASVIQLAALEAAGKGGRGLETVTAQGTVLDRDAVVATWTWIR